MISQLKTTTTIKKRFKKHAYLILFRPPANILSFPLCVCRSEKRSRQRGKAKKKEAVTTAAAADEEERGYLGGGRGGVEHRGVGRGGVGRNGGDQREDAQRKQKGTMSTQ